MEGLKPGEIGVRLGADLRSRASPEVARPEENDRPREKTVTKMSANTTNSSKGSMDCGRVAREEILESYLVGRLSDEDRDAFEAHYFECARCFDELQTLQAIQAELRQAAAEFGRNPTRPLLRWARAAGLAAAVVLAVGVCLWMRPSCQSGSPEPSNAQQPPSLAQPPSSRRPRASGADGCVSAFARTARTS